MHSRFATKQSHLEAFHLAVPVASNSPPCARKWNAIPTAPGRCEHVYGPTLQEHLGALLRWQAQIDTAGALQPQLPQLHALLERRDGLPVALLLGQAASNLRVLELGSAGRRGTGGLLDAREATVPASIRSTMQETAVKSHRHVHGLSPVQAYQAALWKGWISALLQRMRVSPAVYLEGTVPRRREPQRWHFAGDPSDMALAQ